MIVGMTSVATPWPALTRPDGTALRVLVVDDEPTIAELRQHGAALEGWEVTVAHDGATAVSTALRRLAPTSPSSTSCCRTSTDSRSCAGSASRSPQLPVLFLTARDAVEDRIAGLTAGGDDYVTKPFSLEEVVARLRALLRRSGAMAAQSSSVLTVGDLSLDEDSHEVARAGDGINLTATEFELLRFLMRNPRRVLRRPRSSTASGTTTSVARRTSSSCTSPTCARRSMPGVSR